MFRQYKDISDVVSLLIYCPTDRTFLLNKESNGEFWIPSSKVVRNCWNATANKIYFEIFGVDCTSQFTPLRLYKVWLPHHPLPSVYHSVYKVVIRSELKKKIKHTGTRNRLQWFNMIELERQRAHTMLRSPELMDFALIAIGETKEGTNIGILVEISEDSFLSPTELGGSGAATNSVNYQLLSAAKYAKEDQLRIYREFITLAYPASFMSQQNFIQFMTDLGWQKAQCANLFRAADLSSRGGLNFAELIVWCAAIEPATHHSGSIADTRCRYIFRYYDSNLDTILEYVEFKELVAAARASRQLSVDPLSVAKDVDTCIRLIGLQPNSQLSLEDFLKTVTELKLRGTSSMLRSPKSVIGYLADLHDEIYPAPPKGAVSVTSAGQAADKTLVRNQVPSSQLPEYAVAVYSVRLRRHPVFEMPDCNQFDELCSLNEAVSPSTARLVSAVAAPGSADRLAPGACPVEALAAVHYFAAPIEKPSIAKSTSRLQRDSQQSQKRSSVGLAKAAYAWMLPCEEASLGSLLIKLAEAVRPIVAKEPRLLRINSPAYAIGDLHGNLAALLTLEMALWPSGPALAPAKLLFLGDYVDRGPHGSELMAYLLAAKLQRPQGVFMIRGNHETRDIQKMFTFSNECVDKYGETDGPRVWNAINQVFDALPLAAVVDDKVFCCHGGIPPPWVCPLISAIDKVPVPLVRPAEQSTIAWELLWNDPVKPNKMTATLALELAANEGFAVNSKRGTGHVFDQTALDRFLNANQLSHVVRAHEVQQIGFMCQQRGRLVSVFSSSHYCGGTNDCGIALLEGGKLRLLRILA